MELTLFYVAAAISLISTSIVITRTNTTHALIYLIAGSGLQTSGVPVSPKAVGIQLFGPYLLAVELASILLLAALVGAYHLGRRYLRARREEEPDG